MFLDDHPKDLKVILLICAFYFIGQITLVSNIALYAINDLGLSSHKITIIYGVYYSIGAVYSILGGTLVGKYGYREGFLVGLLFIFLAFLMLSIKSITTMYLGLVLYGIGSHFSFPAITCIIGQLYKKDDPLRANGFIYQYAACDVGFFVTAFASGFIVAVLGYSQLFMIPMIVTICISLYFFKVSKKFAIQPDSLMAKQQKRPINKKIIGTVKMIAIAAITVIPYYFLVASASAVNLLLLLTLAGVFIYFTITSVKNYRGVERKKILVFIGLCFISIFAWTLYNFSPTILTVFIEKNVNRNILGYLVPTQAFTSLNPLIFVIISPLIAMLLKLYAAKRRDISTLAKVIFSMVFMGVGYLIFIPAIFSANFALVGSIWILASYLIQTTAEVFLGPVTYSMVGELVPQEKEGTMLGLSLLSYGGSSAVCSYFSIHAYRHVGSTLLNSNTAFLKYFIVFGGISLCFGIILFLFRKSISKKIW